MAKWTNYYRLVEPKPIVSKVTDNQTIGDQGAYGNFSWYQRLVQGSASRLTRYREYDLMDNDVEVARALDTIAEEMLGNQPKSNEPLIIEVDADKEESVKNTTVMTLKTALKYWSQTHDWHNKLFNVARATVKYGDCFFEKKKEKPDKKWEYIHPKNVVGALVDNEDITKVLGWQIKRDTKEVRASYGVPVSNTSSNIETEIVPDNQIVRFTLNDDMSDAAPFGDSVLGPVYRSHKQKELLEDSVLIYRIQRAPERRAFYIDVGKMPPMRVKTYLEQFKNEIKQKRVPNIHGGQSNVDSVYNPQSMCLALDTKIPLLDGRTLSLNELIEEYNQGKENWVYSIDPETGDVVPGPISWAGVTRKDADTIKLILDNGEEIVCTPDHKFPVQGKGFVKAEELTPDDSLWPFNVKKAKISTKDKETSGVYSKVYNPATKGWKYVHRLVANYMKERNEHNEFVFNEDFVEKEKRTIHHVNFSSLDNAPPNLAFMNHEDHVRYHKSFDINQEVKFSIGLFERFEQIANENLNIKFKDLMVKLNEDNIFMGIYAKINLPEKRTSKIKASGFRQKMFLKFIKNFGYKNWRDYRNKKIQSRIDVDNIVSYNSDEIKLLQFVIRLVKEISVHNFAIVNYLKSNDEVWQEFKNLYDLIKDESKPGHYQKLTVPEAGMLERISKYFGYKSFKHLVNESANFNHRVVRIEKGTKQDTGTLTIDKEEKYHNYHTFAIDFNGLGVFVRNSEDFFFAQRCLSLSTKIKLVDGRDLTLKEIIDEYKDGKVNSVYSINKQTLEPIIGEIEWAGVTRKNAEIVEVTLNNDEKIICTPDHKFVLKNGKEIEAQYLVPEMILPSVYHIDNQVSKVEWLSDKEDTGCLTIKDPGDNHNFALSSGIYVKNSDGKGTKVETLPGGQGLGELADLEYFQKKVWRGLRIPTSYMTEGAEGAVWNDGKVGTAYILELRFSLYIMRLQAHIEVVLDREFKNYLRRMNIIVDESIYKVRLPEPSNFGTYRQQEVDAALLGMYGTADGIPYLSKRFIMSRYLQLSDEEIIENERMLREEKGMEADAKTKQELTMIYGMPGPEEMGGGAAPGMTAPPPGVPGPEAAGGEAPPGGEAGGGGAGGAV